jgi:hypothetical protein
VASAAVAILEEVGDSENAKNASRKVQNASSSISVLFATSALPSSPVPVLVREVGVVCGCEDMPEPEKSKASESASLMLKSRLDGGSGKDGGSLSAASDHNRCATIPSSSSPPYSSSLSLPPWPWLVSSSSSDTAGSEPAGVLLIIDPCPSLSSFSSLPTSAPFPL